MKQLLIWCIFILITTSSCSVEATASPPTLQIPSLTAPVVSIQQTLTVSETGITTSIPVSNDLITVTPLSETSQVGDRCDLAKPGFPMDVNIPDGTKLRSGETFSKTWRLINGGTCVWSREYAVVWFSGSPLGLQHTKYLNRDVLPGEYLDITIDMVAPTRSGSYQSNWMLRSSDGVFFGIGPKGESPFWVRIEIPDISTPAPTTSPQPTPTLTPLKYASGKIIMAEGDHLNLDDGDEKKDGDDIVFLLNNENLPQIAPENGARLAVFGNKSPTRKDCQSVAMNSEPIVWEHLDRAIYLCYQTNRGAPGYILISKINQQERVAHVEYFTWLAP